VKTEQLKERIIMNLAEYFDNTEGLGILATSDADGKVDIALYTNPHVIDQSTIAFIMRERLTHQNLQTNPCAAYMFLEQGVGSAGKRLYLTKIREQRNSILIKSLSRQSPTIRPECLDNQDKYLVHFRVDGIRPLVGDKALDAALGPVI
jgi:hypothetical protein